MTNCPKCNDPVQEGETFCGKCGTLIPTGKEKASEAKPQGTKPAETPPAAAKPAKKKRKLWPIFLVGGILIFIGIIVAGLLLVGFNMLGKSAAIKEYINNTKPDFEKVVEDIGKLETNLTYESNAQTAEETKKEVDF